MTTYNNEGRYLHPELAKDFGINLEKIFGPVDERTISLKSIKYDYETLSSIFDKFKGTSYIIPVRFIWGQKGRPSFELELFREMLVRMRDSGAFWGYKLPTLDLHRQRDLPSIEWKNLFTRTDVNREINIKHIIENIICHWDVRYNDPIFCRILSDNTGNVNDHQHGGLARLLMGAPNALIDPIYCDKASTDSEMYEKRNGRMLKSSWENRTINSITVVADKKAEGCNDIDPEDEKLYNWFELLKKRNISFQASKGAPKGKWICNRGQDLHKHYIDSKIQPFYEDILDLHIKLWPNGEISHEVVWGLGRFFHFYQVIQGFSPAKMKELKKIVLEVMMAYYPESYYGNNYFNRSTSSGKNATRTFWGETNWYRNVLEEQDGDDWRLNLDRGLIMASTLQHMIQSYNKFLVDTGKTKILPWFLPTVTSDSGKPIDFKNPLKIANQEFNFIEEEENLIDYAQQANE